MQSEVPLGEQGRGGPVQHDGASQGTPEQQRNAQTDHGSHLFQDTINHLPGGKAPGPDGVLNEAIKLLPDHTLTSIHDLFVLMWVQGLTPDAWKQFNTVLLYKAKDPTDPANYRPVGLANCIYKVWTSTMTKALAGYAEHHNILSSTQEGFRTQKSTHRQLMCA